MPSAQVIDFGEDPYANAMGDFAKNFLSTLNQKQAQRRNEELFKKIADKYGEDANPEMFLRDVIQAEGLDQEFKRDKIKDITEWAKLATKSNLNPYEQAKLDQRADELKVRKETNRIADERLKNEKNKLETREITTKNNISKGIGDYTSKRLKSSDINLPVHDVADINSFMEQLVGDEQNPINYNDAFKIAYNYIQARRERIEDFEITPRPEKWVGSASPEEIENSFQKAYEELKFLHDEDGVENQKELREIAKKGNWKPEEITSMLQRIFQSKGKKLLGPAPKSSPNPEESAQIPFQKQGQVSEAAGLDDILFGE